MTLPFVDYGVGRRQIRYEWPAISEEQAVALEKSLSRDWDYPRGSVHIDGFRIPTSTGFKFVNDPIAEDGIRIDGTEEIENYWRKPLWSRKELLTIFAEHGVKHVRGYDLPLGHGSPEHRYTDTSGRENCLYVGHDDSPDAIVTEADIFEIDLPYDGPDPHA